MGDAHFPVVDNHAEVVGGCSVRASNDQVVKFVVGHLDRTFDQVIPDDTAADRVAKSHHRLDTLRDCRKHLAGLRTPASVVTRLGTTRLLLSAHRIELFATAIAVISGAVAKHLRDDLAIAIHALGLVERTFVMLQAEPGHAVKDRPDRLRRGTLQIGVFDAQDEVAIMVASVRPGVQRGSRTADVQKASRARREPRSHAARGVVGRTHGLVRQAPWPAPDAASSDPDTH